MIGERIRAQRTELNLSLRDLAKKVGLTASFLSQIERNLADPSIKSLRKIADALGVPVLYFLAERKDADPIVRKENRKKLVLANPQVTYELLTPDLNRKMEMFLAHLSPSQENIALSLAHPTEECILVLEGRLHVQLDGKEYELDAGDSIYFEGSQLGALKAIGPADVVFIMAITPAVF